MFEEGTGNCCCGFSCYPYHRVPCQVLSLSRSHKGNAGQSKKVQFHFFLWCIYQISEKNICFYFLEKVKIEMNIKVIKNLIVICDVTSRITLAFLLNFFLLELLGFRYSGWSWRFVEIKVFEIKKTASFSWKWQQTTQKWHKKLKV